MEERKSVYTCWIGSLFGLSNSSPGWAPRAESPPPLSITLNPRGKHCAGTETGQEFISHILL